VVPVLPPVALLGVVHSQRKPKKAKQPFEELNIDVTVSTPFHRGR